MPVKRGRKILNNMSKHYKANTDKIIELLARHKQAEKMRPRIMEWVEATGIPVKTLYRKIEKLEGGSK